jgi:hypothetical protein
MTKEICELATTLPRLVANLLDRESKLRRGRFREETLTDIFTSALAAFAGPELVIEYPPEAATGSDIDLDFWHVNSGRRLLLRIQAKRLNAGTNHGKAVTIGHRAYSELLHQVPKKVGRYQFDTLVRECGPFLPLYMFYNHGSVARDPYFRGAKPTIRGINLAFAFDIADEMRAEVAAKPKRPHHKRLNHLRKHLFGLEAILCPVGEWDGTVPSPDAVSVSIRHAWENTNVVQADRSEDERVARWLREPKTIEPDYHLDRRLPDGPAIRINQTLDRSMITFITGRTYDGRTPRISNDVPDI